MDNFFSLYYSLYLEGLFLHMYIARQGGIQMAYGHALLWISMANPFLWMTAARCATAAVGISNGCVMV